LHGARGAQVPRAVCQSWRAMGQQALKFFFQLDDIARKVADINLQRPAAEYPRRLGHRKGVKRHPELTLHVASRSNATGPCLSFLSWWKAVGMWGEGIGGGQRSALSTDEPGAP
jgi:hypothetical protein